MRFLIVFVFLFSGNAMTYPIILKITNTCNNPLHLQSRTDRKITIPSQETLEILVFSSDGWRVQYQSGVAGKFSWNFDEPLHAHIQGCQSWCRNSCFLICRLEFGELQRGYIQKSYVMKTKAVLGDQQMIPCEQAMVALGAYFDSGEEIVTADVRPSLRHDLAPGPLECRNRFFLELQRQSFDQEGQNKALVLNSKILEALIAQDKPWESVYLGASELIILPPDANTVTAAGILAAVWNLLPGRNYFSK